MGVNIRELTHEHNAFLEMLYLFFYWSYIYVPRNFVFIFYWSYIYVPRDHKYEEFHRKTGHIHFGQYEVFHIII